MTKCSALQCDSTEVRRYLNADACDIHAPWAHGGRVDPRTQIDPELTDHARRVMHTPEFAKGGTDVNKERPGGYMSRQRAVKVAAQRDAESVLQHPERAE